MIQVAELLNLYSTQTYDKMDEPMRSELAPQHYSKRWDDRNPMDMGRKVLAR
jgi:hypothetical protein